METAFKKGRWVILYISENKKSDRKSVIGYLCVSIFCVIFSTIYEYFSHGVYSNFMIYMFLFPLLGGVFPFLAVSFIHHLPHPCRLSANLYNSGIATLTVGSCLQGVLDIYGTSSDYMIAYWILGIIFIVVGLLVYKIQFKK